MTDDEIKNGIIIESQNVLTSYVGKTVSTILLKNIQADLERCLNAFLAENEVYGRHFPIEFENELGTWMIYETGKVIFRHKNDIESITCNITIQKTNMALTSDYFNVKHPLTDTEIEVMSNLYASMENSCFTNDYNGYKNGYTEARAVIADIIIKRPNDAELGSYIRSVFNEKRILYK